MAGKGEVDDDDGSEDAIAARASAEFQRRMEAAPDDDDTVEVQDPPEPDDDDELDETPQAPGRKAKRAARSTARERAAAAEAEARVLREQNALLLSRPQAAPQQQQTPQSLTADIDRQIKDNYKRQKALHADYDRAVAAAGPRGLTPRETEEWEDKAVDLDVENKSLVYRRENALQAPTRARDAEAASLRARAPDVYGDSRAYDYAVATFNRAILAGEKQSLELHDRVMEETRQVIFNKRPPPDKAQRARASGMSAGARPAGAPERTILSMPKGSMYDRVARAAFPHLDPAEARQRWANTVGKDLLKGRP